MRKITGRTTLKDKLLKNPLGKKIYLYAGIGTMAVASALVINNNNSGSYDTVATVKDIEGDRYEGTVPLLNKDGEVIASLENGTIVYVDGKISKKSDEESRVRTISEDGSLIEGTIPNEYLTEIKKIKEKELEKFDTIYKVIPEIGANIRKTPVQQEGNKIGAVAYEEYVLGSTKTYTDANKFLWVPVIYVNEENQYEQGFIRSDLLKQMSFEENKDENTSEVKEEASAEKRERRIVDTSRDDNVDLKLRSDTVIDKSNIISKIPNGSIVYVVGDTVKNNDHTWTEIEYEDKDGNINRGWVVSSYLKEDKIVKVVDTTSDNYHDLNLRQKPGLQGKIIATIKHGAQLELSSDDIENLKQADNRDWVKVTLPDGTTGYVSYSFLRDKTYTENVKDEEKFEKLAKDQEEAIEDVKNSFTQNSYGKVTGIDISSATPEELRKLLRDSKVPSHINEKNTEDLEGNINYVYIKLGASSFGKNNPFKVLMSDRYVEQAKVCEEFGIPFGFYYYSTSVNEEEANKEAKYIEEALDSVKDMKYNILPFAVDVELANNDRQAGIDTTEAKAKLANLLEKDTGKTIVYTAYRAALSGEKIFDLNRYNDMLKSGPANVWASTFRNNDGTLTSSHQAFCNYVVNDTDSTLSMVQGVMDVKLDGVLVDINKMDSEAFINMLTYKNQEVTTQKSKNMDVAR